MSQTETATATPEPGTMEYLNQVYVNVIIKSFDPPMCRVVKIERPATSDEELVQQVMLYGQNEVTPIENCPSVSAGDIIVVPDSHRKLYIRQYSFREMKPEEYRLWLAQTPAERLLSVYSLVME